jgi:hypothetical protein
MSEAEIANSETWPTEWPEWVLSLLAQFEEAERPTWYVLPDAAPPWVTSMALSLFKVMMPTTHKQLRCQSGPAVLGACVGNQEWMFESENGMSKQLERMEEAGEKLLALLEAKLNPTQFKRFLETAEKYGPDVEKFFDDWRKSVSEKMNS